MAQEVGLLVMLGVGGRRMAWRDVHGLDGRDAWYGTGDGWYW